MSSAPNFAPFAAATGEAVKLSMQRLWLAGQVLPAGARLVAQHVFRSDEEKPIEVIYAFPLPRDAALRRFRITGEGSEAHSVTVYLEILCGVELRDDGFRFRFPFTLAPAYHPRARTAVAENGEGEMELPGDEFGDVSLPRFRQDPSALHQVGFEISIVSRLEVHEIGSPSLPSACGRTAAARPARALRRPASGWHSPGPPAITGRKLERAC
jgi:hypothetical protein